MLEAEYKYHQDHKKELLARFAGRFLVIKGDAVLGDFATQQEALAFALRPMRLVHSWCKSVRKIQTK